MFWKSAGNPREIRGKKILIIIFDETRCARKMGQNVGHSVGANFNFRSKVWRGGQKVLARPLGQSARSYGGGSVFFKILFVNSIFGSLISAAGMAATFV